MSDFTPYKKTVRTYRVSCKKILETKMFTASQEVHLTIVLIKFKMNKIVNKFLLTEDKFMPKLYQRHRDLLIVLMDRLLNIVKEFKN